MFLAYIWAREFSVQKCGRFEKRITALRSYQRHWLDYINLKLLGLLCSCVQFLPYRRLVAGNYNFSAKYFFVRNYRTNAYYYLVCQKGSQYHFANLKQCFDFTVMFWIVFLNLEFPIFSLTIFRSIPGNEAVRKYTLRCKEKLEFISLSRYILHQTLYNRLRCPTSRAFLFILKSILS